MGGGIDSMAVGSITEQTIRDTLRAIRYSKPPSEIPLLDLDVVALKLREEGVSDNPESRAWVLGRLLHEVVGVRLASKRGDELDVSTASSPSRIVDIGSLDLVESDFRSGSIERESWSMLHARYLIEDAPTYTQLAGRLNQTTKTLERRLARGHQVLADVMRDAELEAGRRLAEDPGAPVPERILVSTDGERFDVVDGNGGGGAGYDRFDLLDLLLEAVRSDAKVVKLTGDQARAIAGHSVADIVDYRLGRIAQWSRPRYRLDGRFVDLSLLVDVGEESAEGRWRTQEKRFDDLKDVLTEVDDPALVLLGSPGSGKSTLLRRLELDLAVEGLCELGNALTFYVPLNQFPADGTGVGADPRTWLAERWSERYPALPSLETLRAEGRLILLLDALNEMPHRDMPHYRALIRRWKAFLLELAAQGAGNRVVFSCRSLDYSAPLSTPNLRVPQLRIEPMSDAQVHAFIRRHHPARCESIWRQLAGSRRLEILRIPFFLKLLVDHVSADGRVPEGRAGLITGFVRRALAREIERDHPLFQPGPLISDRDYQQAHGARTWRSPTELPCRGPLFPWLAALAFEMQSTHTVSSAAQVRIDYDEALEIIDDPQAENALRAGESLAVLDEDRDLDKVQFIHQLVQEYFAARRFVREPRFELCRAPWRAATMDPPLAKAVAALASSDPLPALPKSGWEQTIIMASAMADDPADFLRSVAEHNIVLAAQCAVQPEVTACLDDATLRSIRRSLSERMSNPQADLRARIEAADAAGALGDPRFHRRAGADGPFVSPPLVAVPGGRYVIGHDEPITYMGEENSSHVPAHAIELKPFSIGRFPVTNAEWTCFVDAGGYEDERWWVTESGRAWRRGEGTVSGSRSNAREWWRFFKERPHALEDALEKGEISEAVHERWHIRLAMSDEEFETYLYDFYPDTRLTTPEFWADRAFNQPLQPVVGVCWYEAIAYATWLSHQSGERFDLPSEAEWEAAARGAGGSRFAYGDTFDPWRANTLDTHVRGTLPVGVFPDGASPFGAEDMTGNVWEWTRSAWGRTNDPNWSGAATFAYPYDPDDGREQLAGPPDLCRVLRGGSWISRPESTLVYARNALLPGYRYHGYGLRLVRHGLE